MNFISRSGWLNSTRLNYGLMLFSILALFFSFSFNLNKFFGISSTGYFLGLNVSLPQIVIFVTALIIVLKSSSKIWFLNLLLFVQSIIFAYPLRDISVLLHFVLVWSSLVVWIFLIVEIYGFLVSNEGNFLFLDPRGVSNFKSVMDGVDEGFLKTGMAMGHRRYRLMVFGGLALLGYFCLDYLNFLLPIPLLFLLIFWLWLKSTKSWNWVYKILIGYLTINLCLAIYQVFTSHFLGLNWLGENYQTAELARQNIQFLNFKAAILRGYGLLVHPNNLGMLGLIGLFCNGIFSLKEDLNKNKTLNKLLIVVSTSLILLSFSRLSLVLLILLYALKFNWNWAFLSVKKMWLKIILLFLTISIFTIIWLGRSSSDFFRIEEFLWWSKAFTKIQPLQILFGSGLGSSPFILKNTLPELYSWAFQPAHFGLINIIVEVGILPIMLVFIYFISRGRFGLFWINIFSKNSPKEIDRVTQIETQLGMDKIIWLTSFGRNKDNSRFEEILHTIQNNIKLNIFDEIYLFSEDQETLEKVKFALLKMNILKDSLNKANIEFSSKSNLQNDTPNSFNYNHIGVEILKSKIHFISSEKNLNIQEMFNHITLINNKDIVVLSNADIQFNEDFGSQLKVLKEKDFWAITRYQNGKLYSEGRINKLNQLYSTSQDVWVSYYKNWCFPKNYNLGQVAIDNCLAFQAFKFGLNVSNPSLDIICKHNHKNNQNLWVNKDEYHGWRLFIIPTKLTGDNQNIKSIINRLGINNKRSVSNKSHSNLENLEIIWH